MQRTIRLLPIILLGQFPALAHAEPHLYETGPVEKASYLRFVNATGNDLTIVSSSGQVRIQLGIKDATRATNFFSVKSGEELSATIQLKAVKRKVTVSGQPWENITIVVLPDGPKRVKTSVIKETPTDFNAMRVSLALFNLDEGCATALMQGGSKRATILDQVQPFSVKRRLVNPVKLTAMVGCASDDQMRQVDFEQLQAGERYSVFLLNDDKREQAFFVRDSN